MAGGIDEALKGQIEGNVEKEEEGNKNKEIEGKKSDETDENLGGIGEGAQEKINELTESNKAANELIDKLGGIDKAKQWVDYLSSSEFKELTDKKSPSKEESPEGDEYNKAVSIIKELIADRINPMQNQINSLSKQSIDKISSIESGIQSTKINSALDSLSSKYPDLVDYREGIIKNAKELYPKGNFTADNIRSLYLISKIEAGKLSDGTEKKSLNTIKDINEEIIESVRSKTKDKSFGEIGRELLSSVK